MKWPKANEYTKYLGHGLKYLELLYRAPQTPSVAEAPPAFTSGAEEGAAEWIPGREPKSTLERLACEGVVFYVSEKVYCSLIPLQALIQMIAPSFQGVMSNRGVLDLSDCHSDRFRSFVSNMRHPQWLSCSLDARARPRWCPCQICHPASGMFARAHDGSSTEPAGRCEVEHPWDVLPHARDPWQCSRSLMCVCLGNIRSPSVIRLCFFGGFLVALCLDMFVMSWSAPAQVAHHLEQRLMASNSSEWMDASDGRRWHSGLDWQLKYAWCLMPDDSGLIDEMWW